MSKSKKRISKGRIRYLIQVTVSTISTPISDSIKTTCTNFFWSLWWHSSPDSLVSHILTVEPSVDQAYSGTSHGYWEFNILGSLTCCLSYCWSLSALLGRPLPFRIAVAMSNTLDFQQSVGWVKHAKVTSTWTSGGKVWGLLSSCPIYLVSSNVKVGEPCQSNVHVTVESQLFRVQDNCC